MNNKNNIQQLMFYEHDYVKSQLECVISKLVADYNSNISESMLEYALKCFIVNIDKNKEI